MIDWSAFLVVALSLIGFIGSVTVARFVSDKR